MTEPTIRLDQLDALAGLLPETTPPRTVAEVARWGIQLRLALQPFVEVSLEAGAPIGELLQDAGLEPCVHVPDATAEAAGPGACASEEQQVPERKPTEESFTAHVTASARPRPPSKAGRAVQAGIAWTDTEDATLMRMWSEGASTRAIAAALPGRTPKSVQVRKARLQKKSDHEAARSPATAAPEVAPAAPEVAPAAPKVALPRLRSAGLSDGAERILAAMAELDDSFEPSDDRVLVEERFKGAAIGGIAEQLGCDEAAVTKRWKEIRGCKVSNKGGLMTDKGWADLRAAAAHRAALAEA